MKPYLGFWGNINPVRNCFAESTATSAAGRPASHGVKKPFFVMAPLANITDAAFRRFLVRYSKPDVMWTEFVSADGLCHPKGREALLRDLWYTEAERPIVAQLFTGHPDNMREAARLAATLGFDGIDINMGCPEKNVMKQGAGAACLKDLKNAQEIIRAAFVGIEQAGKVLPVSVKTRLGINKDVLEELLPALLETNLAAIIIHARTQKEMSRVPAHWDRVKKAVEIAQGSGTLILGNGDITDLAGARKKVMETGADGIMLGRAMFGNPWVFDESKKEITVKEKIAAAIDLTQTFDAVWGKTKNFSLLKKHYQAYVKDFPEAKELRIKLMRCDTAEAVLRQLSSFTRDIP